ncbi:hypothetical protein WISP_00466 [Willisornis vidua]|uniref:Uncharacterized protein n=1 Tax=Willisornis vidua TaxID=1566151 RepID=A0ABQ9DZV4_9PASS|nr:hypothetical protein WISP_00466 [Willisornis vidua]
MDAQLSLVSQHPIGPFPRVQSPTRLKSPSPEGPTAGGPQSPPSPSPPPPPAHPAPPPPDKGSPQAVANQHFIMVEVHQPNSEPDVNEVRPLPQARGGWPVFLEREMGEEADLEIPDLMMDLMIRGLEPLCSGARMGELGVFNLEKRRLLEDLRAPSSAMEMEREGRSKRGSLGDGLGSQQVPRRWKGIWGSSLEMEREGSTGESLEDGQGV